MNFQYRHALVRWPAGLLALWLLGCSSVTTTNDSSIDSLHLLATSVALDLDGKPGPDGLGVRIYASRKDSNDALPITAGTLEVLLFDGLVTAEQVTAAKPFHQSSYRVADLKDRLQKTAIGPSYAFPVVWGDSSPKSARVTVIARHLAPSGKQTYSAPSSVPITLK